MGTKTDVIASQCAHWLAIRIPCKPKACCAFGTKTTLWVVSLKERQRERIATPVCGLVRDDSGYRYSLRFIKIPSG